ncbi:unnamed protein product [Echinostoma caproni]|uniref:Otopetrin-2 n=1 Tax=Echinostoma caproni TaxID=27848 RepID=A0A183ACJ0_9TREM|nr:unnamed protein product [Echinostoma caproni]
MCCANHSEGFGLGVMIHDGFSLSSAWELDQPSCHSELWIPKHVLRLIWVLWQTYFVFKYHRMILHTHKFFVRLAFTHLAAINLCHWIKAVISEVSETLKRADANVETHVAAAEAVVSASIGRNSSHKFGTSSQGHKIGGLCDGHLGELIKPYLYPLAIEYSLITGTLFYKLLQRVGQTSSAKLSKYPSCTSLMTTPRLPDETSPIANLSTLPSLASFGEISSLRAPNLLPYQSTDDVSTRPNRCRKHTSYRQLLGCPVYLAPELDEEEEDQDCSSVKGRQVYKTRADSVQTIHIRPHRTRLQSESYCHRSHTGLFLGLMLFLACIIGVIFTVGRGRHAFGKFIPYVYQYSKIFMLSVSMLACSLALIQTYSMKFRRIKAEESFEYNLLGIGLIGCLTYHMLLFVPSLETVVHTMIYQSTDGQSGSVPKEQEIRDSANPVTIEKLNGTALLYLVKCTLELCQALLQFFFIVEASRRGPCCPNQARIKPGRSAIVFLLINNLALWLMNTFEFRESESQLILHRQYYGIRTWPVITCCFIPLIIFFRFHSTVCLAQIWSKLYELH